MGVARLVYRALLLGSLAASPALAKPGGGISVTGTGQLDPAIWVSTQPFARSDNGDQFLRAYIDKATGEASYQLYVVTRTTRDAFRPSSVTVADADGIEQIPLDRVDLDINCHRRGCIYHEDAIAKLPRALLERIIAGDLSAGLTFKVFGNATEGRESQIHLSEVAEFMAAVDRQLATVTK